MAKTNDRETTPQAIEETHSSNLLWKIPWGHHALLIEKVKELSTRYWYMQQTLAQGWSRNVLALMIDARLYERQGKSTNNFATHLPVPQSDLRHHFIDKPTNPLHVWEIDSRTMIAPRHPPPQSILLHFIHSLSIVATPPPTKVSARLPKAKRVR